MQTSIWLFAFLPYLHWFGSLVNGATVLTSPANPARLVEPQRLNFTGAIPPGLSVIDKERGSELPAAQLIADGITIIATALAPGEFYEYIPSQAWSTGNFILGVSVTKGREGVQRAAVINGFYFIFLLMKQEKDFRSGVFEIQFHGNVWCDLIILPFGSSGLKLAPSFAHVTQLDPPPSPIVDKTKSSLRLAVTGDPDWAIDCLVILPFLIQPMDELGQLISLVDMLVTAAEPPTNEPIRKTGSTILPNTGVRMTLSPNPNSTPYVMTYGYLYQMLDLMQRGVIGFVGQALNATMHINGTYIGEVTMTPTYLPPTNPLIEAAVNTNMADRATARKKRSMAQRL